MRKIYSLLALFLFFVAGAVQAQETKLFWELVDEDAPLTEITPGQYVVLKEGENTGGWSEGGYISSTSDKVVHTVSEGCVFQFEEVGMDGEHKTYAIKNVANGKYLANGEDLYVNNIEDAFICTARLARAVASADQEADADKGDIVEFERAGAAEGVCFVFYNSEGGYYMAFGGNPNFWGYNDTSNWYVYEVKSRAATGRDALNEIFTVYYPNGVDGLYTPGTGVGNVDQAAYDAWMEAYNACVALYEDASATDEACGQAAAAVLEAEKALKATLVPLTAGHYMFVNQRSQDTLYMGANGYANSSNGVTIKLEDLTVANANYIWTLEEAPVEEEAEEGEEVLTRYYFRNFAVGRYVGALVGQTGSGNPSTVEPEVTFAFEPVNGGFFLMADDQGGLGHNAGNGELCKWNDRNATGNWWKIVTVTDEVIAALEGEVVQSRLNMQLETLYDESTVAYNKGRVFIPSADATPDSDYSNDGVFIYSGTGAEANEPDANAWTNAPEYTEGSVAGAFDGDLSTYFHSDWHNAVTDPHFMQFELDEPLQNITLKYTKRNNNGGHAAYWIVYGANDPEGPWVNQGKYTLPYQYACTYPGAEQESANRTGLLPVVMDGAYKYLRLEGASHGIFWHMAEIRIYDGAEYDAANSKYETVDATIRAAFEAARAAADAELKAGKATQKTIDELQTALDNFNEVYPDTAKLMASLRQAEALVDGAVEGDELGYYAEGSVTALEDAIVDTYAMIPEDGNMTYEEIMAARKVVEDAMAVFATQLNMPENGAVYYIKSITEGAAGGSALYAAGTEESVIYWGYFDAENGIANYENHLNCMWKCVVNEDGTYSFQNLHTGYWMGNPKKNDVQVKLSVTPASVGMQSAKVPGGFNFVMDKSVYANAKPGTQTLVTWGTAEGYDNSAFELEAVEDLPVDNLQEFAVNTYGILCLPYSVYAEFDYTVAYEVLGLKDGNLQLGELSSDAEIAAGTPFVYFQEYEFTDDEEEFSHMEDMVYLVDADAANLNYNYEAACVNGLQGTMSSVEIKGEGFGYFATDNEGKFKVRVTEAGSKKKIGMNSGYFVEVPATELDGDVVIPVDGVLTSINAATVVKNENVSVYSLSGVKVRQNVKAGVATNGLPKGLYIVGGKKVLVK